MGVQEEVRVRGEFIFEVSVTNLLLSCFLSWSRSRTIKDRQKKTEETFIRGAPSHYKWFYMEAHSSHRQPTNGCFKKGKRNVTALKNNMGSQKINTGRPGRQWFWKPVGGNLFSNSHQAPVWMWGSEPAEQRWENLKTPSRLNINRDEKHDQIANHEHGVCNTDCGQHRHSELTGCPAVIRLSGPNFMCQTPLESVRHYTVTLIIIRVLPVVLLSCVSFISFSARTDSVIIAA